MYINKKLHRCIAAALIGISLAAVAGLGYLCPCVLGQTAGNGNHILLASIAISIVVFSLVALGVVRLSSRNQPRRSVEESHALLQQFRDSSGFTLHSADDAGEIVVVFERMVSDLHALLQSVQIKAQAVDYQVEVLTKRMQQVATDQANLFSLSTAIESVRAQQDGFSVIFSEILSLIERSGSLTSDVRDMANQLQAGTHEIVAELEQVPVRVTPDRSVQK